MGKDTPMTEFGPSEMIRQAVPPRNPHQAATHGRALITP